MIFTGDIIEVEIEKLTYEGFGIARLKDENNFVIFVLGALPEEKLKVKITKKLKSYAQAEIVEIISSNKRIKPFCAIYNACGSCDMQILSYSDGLEEKNLIIKEIFKDIIDEKNIFPIIKSPVTFEYRKKLQYPVCETKNSKRKLIGYYKKNSHDITNIKFCPLAPDKMNEINEFIRNNFSYSAYNEKTKKGILRHVLARFNSKDEALVAFVLNENKPLDDFIKKLTDKFDFIKGVFININNKNTNKILGDKTFKVFGKNYIIETLLDKKYKIGIESFFQINPGSAVNLFSIVKDNIKENSIVLDAFSGVGAIGIFISEKLKQITLVEENKEASKLAEENFKLNNLKNYEIINGDANLCFKKFKEENKTFDYVIIDPPRKGCDIKYLKEIKDITKNIIYVSCNPNTLKRDIKILEPFGFKVQKLYSVDLFPYTHHIECVSILQKLISKNY